MRYTISARQGYIHAELVGRETAEDMREFLVAVHAGCREEGCPRVLMTIRRSRTIFKVEDYGLATRGYLEGMVTPACQVALLGDTSELHRAHEYVELVARQRKMNVKAFRDERLAIQWLLSSAVPPVTPPPDILSRPS